MSELYSPPIRGLTRWPNTYGQRRSATHTHQGLDFAQPEGTPVVAIANGTIDRASSVPAEGFAGYGRHVVLKFDDADGPRYALYAHLATVNVEPGQQVHAGQQLGTVGRSQFRSAASFRRSGRAVPNGYRQELDDAGRYPARGGRPMAAHLHFELARTPYPMGPEAPNRVDPRQWAIARGLLGGASPPPRPATPPALASSSAPRATRPASGVRPPRVPTDAHLTPEQINQLRHRIVAAVTSTEPVMVRAQVSIAQSGIPAADTAAAWVRSTWETSRNAILGAVRGADLEPVRVAIQKWVGQLVTMRDRARGFGAPGRALADVAERLRRLWEGALLAVKRAVQVMAGAGAVVAASAISGWLLLALVMLGGQVLGGRAAYRYGRRKYRELL